MRGTTTTIQPFATDQLTLSQAACRLPRGRRDPSDALPELVARTLLDSFHCQSAEAPAFPKLWNERCPPPWKDAELIQGIDDTLAHEKP